MKKLLTILILLCSLSSFGQFGLFQAHNRVNSTFVEEYGLLYNFFAVQDVRGLANGDFRIPTRIDTKTLSDHLGGNSVAGGKLKEIGFIYWDSPNTGATNEVGFNGRGAGRRFYEDGTFNGNKTVLSLWCSEELVGSGTVSTISYNTDDYTAYNGSTSYTLSKEYGLSIRLLRDATAGEQLLDDGTKLDLYTGNDGTLYETVKIGTQVWTVKNIRETQYTNNDAIPIVTDNTSWSNLTTGAICSYNNVTFVIP